MGGVWGWVSSESWKYIVVQKILRYNTFRNKHLAQVYVMTHDANFISYLKASEIRCVIPDTSALLTDPVQTRQTNKQKHPQVHNFLGQYDKFKLKMKKTRRHHEALGNTSVESNCIERLLPFTFRRRLQQMQVGQIKLLSKLQVWQKVLNVLSPFFFF